MSILPKLALKHHVLHVETWTSYLVDALDWRAGKKIIVIKILADLESFIANIYIGLERNHIS